MKKRYFFQCYKPSKSGGEGLVKPGNIRNPCFEKKKKGLHGTDGLESYSNIRNTISFFIRGKKRRPILRIFLEKNSIVAYIELKIAKLGKVGNYDVIVTSYTGYLYFLIYGKR